MLSHHIKRSIASLRQPFINSVHQRGSTIFQFGGSVATSFIRREYSTSTIVDKLQLGKLNHVAIAVPDLEKAAAFYRDVLQAKKVSEPQTLPEHGVTVVFVELDNTKFELLYPFGEKSPIAGFLAKNPSGGMHHVCIEVADIKKALADVVGKGIRSLDKEPKIGAHGKPVVFLHPKDCGGVLIELEQE
ncbi:hypothetical protein C9374_012594 [Naegleria lovaniensis]|uniref:Methylmalonyl-CoA epimerase, mitochondrial n=1 Tax=Naegleria lovaniensis TaxID=51637 RepID=A0AA88H3B5_NAELO|nr:uncharacterized protein C9374_012594 [Naegleria lovaniensis]KAG2392342.1 hypothetical protein C9374_012594 [Naegleria lovaniensis]